MFESSIALRLSRSQGEVVTDIYQNVTPYTHPERWTVQEKKLFDAGRCCWVIGTGSGSVEHCGEPSEEGASYGYCPEHADQFRENCYPNGTRR
ncbi:hypothetical protein Ppa06_21070 [Planomonospora parontospora subsp. parontospora]|uniref:Uncharacterized protein n=2 Tax=Planomonospora parontospora TaxID=58119 RepID=A0AA37BFG5_9ACTN|nr:hypothetical protein GCM10010126_22480 [Planomonospora parontospora]GII08309.1 hypothetical protein Ppa06_21070 [Planomonospora parontospora subsp. parontospora]